MKTNQNNLQKHEDNSFTLKITLAQKDISDEYQNILKSLQSNYKSKGFREGKVPMDIIEKDISQEKIVSEILSHLVGHAYEDVIKENNLKPIIQPQIKINNPPLTFNKDWEVELISSELPSIKLDEKYQTEIKKFNKSKEAESQKRESKLNKILEIIVNSSTVEMSPMLMEAEIERKMSQLIDQLNQAKLTVNQYLQNKGQTLDQYKEELKKQSLEEWKINLSVDRIAKDQKIEIKPEEAQKYLEKNPQLSQNVNLMYYILIQEKVFEYLLGLK